MWKKMIGTGKTNQNKTRE